jgi:drug/metabolite transporter (DMT)-like permease
MQHHGYRRRNIFFGLGFMLFGFLLSFAAPSIDHGVAGTESTVFLFMPILAAGGFLLGILVPLIYGYLSSRTSERCTEERMGLLAAMSLICGIASTVTFMLAFSLCYAFKKEGDFPTAFLGWAIAGIPSLTLAAKVLWHSERHFVRAIIGILASLIGLILTYNAYAFRIPVF